MMPTQTMRADNNIPDYYNGDPPWEPEPANEVCCTCNRVFSADVMEEWDGEYYCPICTDEELRTCDCCCERARTDKTTLYGGEILCGECFEKRIMALIDNTPDSVLVKYVYENLDDIWLHIKSNPDPFLDELKTILPTTKAERFWGVAARDYLRGNLEEFADWMENQRKEAALNGLRVLQDAVAGH